jgi:hypothetical protein
MPLPISPSSPEALRQIARALRAQRRLAGAARPGYDLNAHRALLRAWRQATGAPATDPAAPGARPERRPARPQTPRGKASLRAQAEALFARRPDERAQDPTQAPPL